MSEFKYWFEMVREVLTFVTLLWAVYGVQKNAKAEMQTPQRLLDERFKNIEGRVTKVEKDIEDVNEKLNRDYSRLNMLEDFMYKSLKAQYALVNNAIDGNNKQELEESKNELKHLIFDNDKFKNERGEY